jgi:hypothetical protein
MRAQIQASNMNHDTLTNTYLASSLRNSANYSLLSSCLSNDARQRFDQPLNNNTFNHGNDVSHSDSIDQQTQVDEWQIQRLFECFPCQMIFKDFAMYCTHKQFHYSSDNPFRCAQCGEQKVNQYDFFVHITQQAHELT